MPDISMIDINDLAHATITVEDLRVGDIVRVPVGPQSLINTRLRVYQVEDGVRYDPETKKVVRSVSLAYGSGGETWRARDISLDRDVDEIFELLARDVPETPREPEHRQPRTTATTSSPFHPESLNIWDVPPPYSVVNSDGYLNDLRNMLWANREDRTRATSFTTNSPAPVTTVRWHRT